MCYYAMHTNFDVMGMADAAADTLALKDRQVLYVTFEDEIAKEGIGRFGRLPEEMTLADCAEYVKKTFQLPAVRVYGELSDVISVAAVSPGSGKSTAQSAVNAGVDVLISGDIDHHLGIDLVAQGVSVIDAGHYGLEKYLCPICRITLRRKCRKLQWKLRKKKPLCGDLGTKWVTGGMDMITLKVEGVEKQYPKGVTFEEVVREYQDKYDNQIALVCYNGK